MWSLETHRRWCQFSTSTPLIKFLCDHFITYAALDGAEKANLVDAYLSLENGPRADLIRSQLRSIQAEFQRFPGDTGSTEVQVAVLTAKIKALAEHLTTHRKDHNSRRGLQGMLNKRRSLLQYLRRTNFDAYVSLIGRLGLKDNYGRQDRFSVRYKAAARPIAEGVAN
jgi:small subunit ribosomal protein S15